MAQRLRTTDHNMDMDDQSEIASRSSSASQLEAQLPVVLWAYAVAGRRDESTLDFYAACLPLVAARIAAKSWSAAELCSALMLGSTS